WVPGTEFYSCVKMASRRTDSITSTLMPGGRMSIGTARPSWVVVGQGVSIILTQEMPELFGVSRLSEYGVSHLSDNVVLLQFVRGKAELRRSITVLKTRASTHDPRSVQYDISTAGFVLGEPLSSVEALSSLAGAS